MRNKNVGYLIWGIAVLLIVIIFLFNSAMKDIVKASCGAAHTTYCPMNQSVDQQTYLALAIVGVLFIIGAFLIFSKPEVIIEKEKIRVHVKEKKKKLDLNGFNDKEKEIVKILQDENGTIFQADLKDKLGVGKVGLTRLLDKLEAKQIIERKRRGMNNIVVLRG